MSGSEGYLGSFSGREPGGEMGWGGGGMCGFGGLGELHVCIYLLSDCGRYGYMCKGNYKEPLHKWM